MEKKVRIKIGTFKSPGIGIYEGYESYTPNRYYADDGYDEWIKKISSSTKKFRRIKRMRKIISSL